VTAVLRAVSILLGTVSLAVLGSPQALTDETLPGDPVAGRIFAERECGDCHDISREGGDYPLNAAPSFLDVATERSTTALSLRVFLRSTHREMPDLILNRREQDDVIAYILSLRVE
jgi:cytochrome c